MRSRRGVKIPLQGTGIVPMLPASWVAVERNDTTFVSFGSPAASVFPPRAA